ncbi:MAG: hypothetical protein AB7N91_09390 [Candidatus Tectimicrobiota bacterium]
MTLAYLSVVALGGFLLALLGMGVSTRRFCQRCDYCGRFYWWIGWAAFEWTSADWQSWAMRCQDCQWLTQQLQTTARDKV